MSPLPGVIESFSQADAVGSIRLDDGREVRFGRSACGFEPIAGTRVEVFGTTPGFRGALKATSVGLGEDRTAHANRLGARDVERGGRPPTMPAGEAAATARELGGLTVLLDEELPRDHGGLLAWALALPLEKHGFSVEMESGTLIFRTGAAKLRAIAGHDPYPADQTDRSDVGAAFSTGRGSITLLFNFLPRSYYVRTPDAWLALGYARIMSRLATMLLERGHAVIVHRAAELVVPGPMFTRRLGDLRDPQCVPFPAWMDLRVDADTGALITRGLRAFGLPEVRVDQRAEPNSWASARRFEAALFACYCLCRGMWIENGLFEVPRRIQIGAFPAELVEPMDVERWEAKAEGGGINLDGTMHPIEIVLHHRPDSDDAVALWAQATSPQAPAVGKLGHGGYEALFLAGLMGWLRLTQVGITSAIRARVAHRLITLRGEGPHFVLTTSGFGRLPQPGGDRRLANDHVEIAAFVPARIAPMLAEIVGFIGSQIHAADRKSVFAPWGIYENEIAPFLLRPWGPVSMGAGAGVTILELLPLDPAEAAWVRAAPAAAAQRFSEYDQAASAARWARVPTFAGRA
jgi:hypothetical protein